MNYSRRLYQILATLAMLLLPTATIAQDLAFCAVPGWRQQVQVVPMETDARYVVFTGQITGPYFVVTQATDGVFVGEARVVFLLPQGTGVVVLVQAPAGVTIRTILCMRRW